MEKVWEAVSASGGGAFVLFTSHRLLRKAHAALAPRLAAASGIRSADWAQQGQLSRCQIETTTLRLAAEAHTAGPCRSKAPGAAPDEGSTARGELRGRGFAEFRDLDLAGYGRLDKV